MLINTNVAALNASNNFNLVTKLIESSMAKLATGKRINSAKDDASGLAITTKMTGQIQGLQQASRNAQNASSMIGTAETNLNETHEILKKMRVLAGQSANSTNTETDRKHIQDEMNQLKQEIDRIGTDTEFNTMKLLNGAFSGAANAMNFHIGANSNQVLKLEISDMRSGALGISGATASEAISITSYAGSQTAITALDDAMELVSSQRSKLGAVQNRLEYTVKNLNTSAINLDAAKSLIEDLDVASETVKLTKNQIIQQMGISMLAQANSAPQSILSLLR